VHRPLYTVEELNTHYDTDDHWFMYPEQPECPQDYKSAHTYQPGDLVLHKPSGLIFELISCACFWVDGSDEWALCEEDEAYLHYHHVFDCSKHEIFNSHDPQTPIVMWNHGFVSENDIEMVFSI
jgi:hypothetical protein